MFKHGNNYGGRKLGSKNILNNEIRLKFKELLEANIETIQANLDKLEAKDKLKVILDLAQYVLPKLRHTDLDATVQGTGDHDELLQRIYNLSDSDIDKLTDE